ncbi:M16 family metallopeptidase [Kribbella kalugense]|uniref:Putative Zn-dependent peptidase n=1 Tax=Kribbella kalugense TaxID=2512221 RepID=A0A4R7ZPR5_9ACTN|nr:pitrilysin family protein [Kribbella kalugense]TDW19525.1 putative Zn-dependent peptidase [Kribbella kalugense]
MPLTYPIVEQTLDNGLRVVVSSDRAVPIVAVNLWYDVGSRHEPAGLTGFAHLFEHLMFQGSRNVASGQHFSLLETAGASLNASTFFDRTNYFESLPSGGLDLALWLEADRMGYLLDAVNQENLDNQRDVVKEEKRQTYDNRPYGDSYERLVKLAFPEGHPYAHMTIGSMADLDAASVEDVHAFFRKYYGPNNAVLTIVGDVSEEDAFDAAKRYFGHLPAIPQPPPAPDGTIGPMTDVQRDDVESDVPSDLVTMMFRLPVDGTPELDAAGLALDILAAGQSGRLNRRLVRDEQIAQSVSGGALPLIGGVSFGTLTGIASDGIDLQTVEDALLEEIEKLAEEGVTEDELATVQAQAERDWLEQLASCAGRADEISHHALLFGDPGRINTRIDQVQAVTVEQVQAAARQWIRANGRVQVTYRRKEAEASETAGEQA